MLEKLEGTHLPCPSCSSSDAFAWYDTNGYCHACEFSVSNPPPSDSPLNFQGEQAITTAKKKSDVRVTDSADWNTSENTYANFGGFSQEVVKFYDIQAVMLNVSSDVFRGYKYPTCPSTGLNVFQARKVTGEITPKNKFLTIVPSGHKAKELPTLFGMDKVMRMPNKPRYITIVEGVEDALAFMEMTGFPAVAVFSSSSAAEDVRKEYERLKSFDRIYLALDNDEPGRKATEAVAALFDYGKCYQMDLAPHKDARDWWDAGEQAAFNKRFWQASPQTPDKIISSTEEFVALANKEIKNGLDYPWEGLTKFTYGLRTGESVLVTAQEGVGKTEVLRAIEHSMLKADIPIGVLHLEETPQRFLKGLAGLELNRPVHLPDCEVSDHEVDEAIRSVVGENKLFLYDHFGSNDLNTIVQYIRYLAKVCGCKYIFIDHISIIVQDGQLDDERKALDSLSTQFATLVKELDIGIIFVSHLNDDGKTRGSRNMAKIADAWWDLNRNPEADDPTEANTTTVVCRKNRFAGTRGTAARLFFDLSTYTFSELDKNSKPPITLEKEWPF